MGVIEGEEGRLVLALTRKKPCKQAKKQKMIDNPDEREQRRPMPIARQRKKKDQDQTNKEVSLSLLFAFLSFTLFLLSVPILDSNICVGADLLFWLSLSIVHVSVCVGKK